MNRLIKPTLLLLSAIYIVLLYFDDFQSAFSVKSLALFGLLILFYKTVRNRRLWFGMFLLFFSLAELFNLLGVSLENFDVSRTTGMIVYYVVNVLFIVSFIFLIVRILKALSLFGIIKSHGLHLVILIAMNVFCVYSVMEIIGPSINPQDILLIYIYYTTLMTLMTVAFLNFLQHSDKKAFFMLVGSLFLVLSEVVQITYFHILENKFLTVLWSVFSVFAFVFFYLQATMVRSPKFKTYDEHILQDVEI